MIIIRLLKQKSIYSSDYLDVEQILCYFFFNREPGFFIRDCVDLLQLFSQNKTLQEK